MVLAAVANARVFIWRFEVPALEGMLCFCRFAFFFIVLPFSTT